MAAKGENLVFVEHNSAMPPPPAAAGRGNSRLMKAAEAVGCVAPSSGCHPRLAGAEEARREEGAGGERPCWQIPLQALWEVAGQTAISLLLPLKAAVLLAAAVEALAAVASGPEQWDLQQLVWGAEAAAAAFLEEVAAASPAAAGSGVQQQQRRAWPAAAAAPHRPCSSSSGTLPMPPG